MAWSAEFLEALDVGAAPMFALDFDFFGMGDFAGYESTKPTLHSHDLEYGTNAYPHAIAEISGAGQSVSVGSWSSNAGGLRVRLAGVEVANYVAQNIPRGLTCKLMMGFEGLDWYRWGRLGTYVYEGLSGTDNRWTMKLGGLLKVLQSNYNRESSTSGFGVSTSATTLTNLNVTATTGSRDLTMSGSVEEFFAPPLSDGYGVAKVTASSGSWSEYYIAYESVQKASSGLPPKLLGVQRDLSFFNTTGEDRTDGGTIFIDGTWPIHIVSGDTITHVNHVFGSLPDFAKRWLSNVSSGYDPNSNLGAPIDRSDWDKWANRWRRYGDFTVDYLGEDYEKNGVSTLRSIMSKMGAWIVEHQGRVSWRFAQDLTYEAGAAIEADHIINEDDIISMDKYSIFHPDRKDQKIQMSWVGLPGFDAPLETRTASIVTQPATQFQELLTGYIFNDSANNASTSNAADASVHLSNRLNPWMRRVPDQLTLNLRGWSWLKMVPGDVVIISCGYIPDFHDKDTGGVSALEMEHFMVCGVNPNFRDFSVTVEFTRLPRKHNPYL